MSNMSYFRFQNTLPDLRDCYQGLDDEIASKEEMTAARALVKLCHRIAKEFDPADFDPDSMPD